MENGMKLTPKEVAAAFGDSEWATKYPPLLTLEQAAELIQIPVQTLYSWRSRGLMGNCSRKIGKHVRVFRDRFLLNLLNEGLSDDHKS